MNQSPMYKHAAESFEHGLEHFSDNSIKGRKFALLHLDQSIELFLKEKAVQIGKSIYKSDGTTLSIHEVFRSLKDIDIPEQPRLEELHDLRNTIQHKGLTPDSGTTEFYVQIAYEFVKRFLNDELGTSVKEILSNDIFFLLDAQPIQQEVAEEIAEAYSTAKASETPQEKIIAGYTALSRLVSIFNDSQSGKVSFRHTLRMAAKRHGNSYDDLKPHLKTIMMIRNQVVHSAYNPTEDDAEAFLIATKKTMELVGCKF